MYRYCIVLDDACEIRNSEVTRLLYLLVINGGILVNSRADTSTRAINTINITIDNRACTLQYVYRHIITNWSHQADDKDVQHLFECRQRPRVLKPVSNSLRSGEQATQPEHRQKTKATAIEQTNEQKHAQPNKKMYVSFWMIGI